MQQPRLALQDRWRRDPMECISQVPRGHHRHKINFKKQFDNVRQLTYIKMNLLRVLSSLSDVNASMDNIYTATTQSTLENLAVNFRLMALSNLDILQVSHNQGM